MRNEDDREHSGADCLKWSRAVRERTLCAESGILIRGFKAGGTADNDDDIRLASEIMIFYGPGRIFFF